MTGRVRDMPSAVTACVVLACLAAAAGIIIASGPPAPAGMVERASYAAGMRHALNHRADPAPSGLPAGADGTNADCRLWFDARPTSWDRDDFLAGCADVAELTGGAR